MQHLHILETGCWMQWCQWTGSTGEAPEITVLYTCTFCSTKSR